MVLIAATATACVDCGAALRTDERLSLIVDITEGTDDAGIEYQTFDARICHRRCREPGLSLRRTTGEPDELATRGAKLTLDRREGARTRSVPVLALRLAPVLTFREPGAEPTSALVAMLLAYGFQLSLTADYDEIIRQTRDVGPDVGCAVTDRGLVSLRIGGEQMHTQRLDPADAVDAAWLEAANHERKVLVLSGDYLHIAAAGLNIDAAARLGTLVTGNVPFRT